MAPALRYGQKMKQRVGIVVLAAASGCGSVSGKTPDAAIDGHSIDSPGMQIDSNGAFTPAQLPGLVLWLDAATGVTTAQSKVSAWADQSGKTNNATQATAAQQPTLVTGVINNHPVVRFDGSTMAMEIADTATLQWGTDDYTIEIVGSWKNAQTAPGILFAKAIYNIAPYAGALVWANMMGASTSTSLGAANESMTGYYVTGGTMGLNDGNPRVYGSRRYGGTNLEVRINGASDQAATTSSAVDVSAVGYPVYLGGHPQSTTSVIQALNGDVAEVVVVHGTLTAAQLGQLETYLKTKYGL